MKTQLNARISEATRAKLDALTVLYGTQAEALAVAIELLHTRETVYGGRYEVTELLAMGKALKDAKETTMEPRYFKYSGEPMLTRGDYGVGLRGGHTTADDPDLISVFDPDTGETGWISVEAGVMSGDWVEVTAKEHDNL